MNDLIAYMKAHDLAHRIPPSLVPIDAPDIAVDLDAIQRRAKAWENETLSTGMLAAILAISPRSVTTEFVDSGILQSYLLPSGTRRTPRESLVNYLLNEGRIAEVPPQLSHIGCILVGEHPLFQIFNKQKLPGGLLIHTPKTQAALEATISNYSLRAGLFVYQEGSAISSALDHPAGMLAARLEHFQKIGITESGKYTIRDAQGEICPSGNDTASAATLRKLMLGLSAPWNK